MCIGNAWGVRKYSLPSSVEKLSCDYTTCLVTRARSLHTVDPFTHTHTHTHTRARARSFLMKGFCIVSCISVTAATRCIGKGSGGHNSSLLPQEECDAWIDFYDATGGPNWSYCSDTRFDPCYCGYVLCYTDQIESPVSVTHITGLRLGPTNLNGTLPASMSNLKRLVFFKIESNHLHGNLPDLPYQNMPGLSSPEDSGRCNLFDHSNAPGGTNSFNCPFPKHVIGNCKMEYEESKYRLVTPNDCTNETVQYQCIDSKCVPRAPGISKHECSIACHHHL